MAGHILKSAMGSVLLLAGVTLLAGCSRETGEAPAPSEASATMPGRQIAENLCARCHAIGLEGDSPMLMPRLSARFRKNIPSACWKRRSPRALRLAMRICRNSSWRPIRWNS